MRIRSFAILSLILLAAAQGASRWQSAGPWGGSATSLAVSADRPDTLLAGSRNSLVFTSIDGGDTWTRLPFPRHFLATVASLAIIDGKPDHYLAGLSADNSPYAGVWLSQDGGQTWAQSPGLAGISVEALTGWAKDPGRWVAGTRDGVWLSTDAGRNWQRISAAYNHELRGITAVAIDPLDPARIYAGTTHLPWRTVDGGKTWSSIHTGMLDDSDVFSIFIDPQRPSRVLASACSGIYRSESAGDTWTKFPGIPATHRRTHVIRQQPGRPEVVFAGTTLGLLKSANGGGGFRQLNQLHVLSMAFDPRDPQRLFLATEGAGLWRSTDGGETVRPINTGFVSRRVVNLAGSGDTLYLSVAGDNSSGGIFTSSDGGRGWKSLSAAGALRDGHVSELCACPAAPKTVLAGNETHVMRSSDGGKTWTAANFGLGGDTRLYALACLQGAAGKALILAGTGNGLLRSSDSGVTWQSVRLTTVNIRHAVQAIYTSPAAPLRLAVRTTQAVYLSEDAGATWRALNILFPVAAINDLALPGTASGLYLIATAQGLYSSEDGGKSWQRRENGLPPGTVSTLAVRPGRGNEVYAAQFGAVYRSLNGGRDWAALDGAGLGETTFRKLTFAPGAAGRLLALTPEFGVLYLDLQGDW
ncbi:MAG: hypothetical protein HZB13_20355 [Acidobacteria bacterium]|nr:hypothetical protein [Acidobacteriota bacterium]